MNKADFDDIRTQRQTPPIQRPGEYRTEFERDYARIISSPSFRRLQGKSQIFGAGSGDFYRTRLTHTLEVAQVARSAVSWLHSKYEHELDALNDGTKPGLMLSPLVVECAVLAHDIGHPPFGHKGEHVINRFLRKHHQHCFESNAQNYRVVESAESRVERDYKRVEGLNLTAAVLLATNKYPHQLWEDGHAPKPSRGSSISVEKGVYYSEWTRRIMSLRDAFAIPPGKMTLEAQLMNVCDDIAYSTHDIEDGIKSELVDLSALAHDEGEQERIASGIWTEIDRDKSSGSIWKGEAKEDIRNRIRREIDTYLKNWS